MRRHRVFSCIVFIWALTPLSEASVIHVPAGADLQQAIDQAEPGDTITLEPGVTYTGNFHLPNKSGTGYITITSSDPATLPPAGTRVSPASAANFPKLKASNDSPAIATDAGAHHYRLVGLEILPAAGVYTYELISLGSGTATLAADLASDVELDRLYIHGDPAVGGKRGVGINSAATVIANCWISDFKSANQEAQAISGWNGPGPFTITNNYIEAAGENFMLGGAAPKIPNLVSSDIIIKYNHFTKPLSWRNGDPSYAGTAWLTRNLLQLRNARKVLIEANVFEHTWSYTANLGFAIELNVGCSKGAAPWAVVEDITIVRNIVRKTGGGVSIVGKDTASSGQGVGRRITIKDNLLYDLSRSPWGGSGRIFHLSSGAADVTIDHVTSVYENPGAILYFEGDPSPRLTFTNTIAPHGASGVIGAGKATGTASLNFFSPEYQFRKNVLPGGTADSYPSDIFFPSSMAGVGFVDLPNDDYHLSTGSPYRSAGTDGKDIGADIDAVLAATRGITDLGATQVPQPSAPLAVSVTPSSGQGSPRTFQLLYSDRDGFADIAWAYFLINSSLTQAKGCYVQYKASQNSLWLRDDDGVRWLGPVGMGSSAPLGNSQCTVDVASSSVSGSGEALSLSLHLRFNPSFTGSKQLYMYAIDQTSRTTGWQLRGVWTPHDNQPPRAVSVTPSSGQGTSQTFQFAYTDANGFADIGWTYTLINSDLNQAGACYVYVNSSSNTVWLRNDAGTAWLGPVVLGAAGVLTNSACTVDAAGSSKTGTDQTLLVNLALAFDPRFFGAKLIHMFGADRGGQNSSWQKRGTWKVAGSPPEAVSVTPSSGQGVNQTFGFLYSDPQGYADIETTYVLIHSALAASGGCYVRYKPGSNSIWLRNDAGTLWLGPLTLGAPGSLSNTRCAVLASASSVVGSESSLLLNLSLRFTTLFAGARTIYMQASDKSGNTSNWQARGTWTVPN